MSSSHMAKAIDRELGDLRNDTLGGSALLSYLRYDVELNASELQRLKPDLTDPGDIKGLSEMDDPDNMPLLYDLGQAIGERDVRRPTSPRASTPMSPLRCPSLARCAEVGSSPAATGACA